MIGNTLKIKRIKAGLTQEQLAVQLGVTRSIIGHWERNETGIPSEYIFPLCQVFHCSPTAFISYDKKTFEWYRQQFKSRGDGLEEFAMANPDLMNMILYLVNEWDGNFSMLVVMAFYYSLLDKKERSHISYFAGMSFKFKYDDNDTNPLAALGKARLNEYVNEWRKLADSE